MKHPTYYKTAPVVDTDEEAEANSNNLHQHVSRATDANWDEYVEKSNRLYTTLENAVRTKNMIPDKFWTFHEWQKNRDKSETLPSEVGAAMDSDGIPSVVSDRYKYVEVTEPKGQTKYHRFFPGSSKPNAMVETFVSKGNDPGLELSEVAFQTAGMDLCGEEEEALLKQLEYIYKAQILNPLTKSIMRQAYAKSCEQKDRIVFKPDTDEFKALLATPNGAMVPHMLIDHAGFFQKTVKEIRLYLDRNMMVFRLD